VRLRPVLRGTLRALCVFPRERPKGEERLSRRFKARSGNAVQDPAMQQPLVQHYYSTTYLDHVCSGTLCLRPAEM